MAVFVLVLVVTAFAVWSRVLSDHAADEKLKARCAAAPPPLTINTVQVRVYNSTDRTGLAARTTETLRKRGFDVVATDNDPTARKVKAVGEVRYGDGTKRRAQLLQAAVPGTKLVHDSRDSSVVDLALGPKYRAVATMEAIRRAEARLSPNFDTSDC